MTVALMGARLHYAVPRLLHEYGALERFYADICAVRGWPRGLRVLPPGLLPAGLRRLAGRVPHGVPARLISAFTAFGLEYQRRRRHAGSISAMTAVHLWAGETFGRLILESGPALESGLYCFNSAGLELLRSWRGPRLLEQTIAPRRVEERILAAEHAARPGWQEAPPRDENVAAYMAREEEEWRHAEVIVCGSDFVRRGVAECGGPVERCVVVPYGIDLQSYSVPARAPLPGRALRVLTVGEVGLRKGAPYVLEAARALGGRAQFRMAGPMGLLPERAEDLRRHVEHLGVVPRAEMAAQYAWADVFLLPSLCEGSATVTYEALAAGLPVVATPSTGSLVRDGESGFLVPEREGAAIATALERFLRDPALLASMAARAREASVEGSLAAYGRRLMAVVRGEATHPGGWT